MKIWIGKDHAWHYLNRYPERAQEKAFYIIWRNHSIRRKPHLSKKEDYIFFSWLGLIIWFTTIKTIRGMSKWDFKNSARCGYIGKL
jgi:hypothetical protein